MRARIAQRRRIEGWGFSLLLHGLLLSALWPLIHHLPVQVHPEPFRWNGVFVESPRQTTAIEPAGDSSSTKEFHRSTETGIHRAVSPPTGVPRPPKQAKKDSDHIAEESNDTRSLFTTPPPASIAQPQTEVSRQTPSATHTLPVTPGVLPGEQPGTSMTAPPVSSEPSASPMASIEQELPSTPATLSVDAAMALVQPMDTPPAPPLPASPVVSGQASTPRPDYTWLQRAVSRRLEELKRTSRPSLDDSNRLNVLVKAVVSSTGELIETEVVKSSGLNRIDQEAMTLVQRAFPMPLDHTLDRQQIVMRIPITYSSHD